jgi:hypothetical protein
MSRYLETSIYSLEGNSIWDVALKFERLALQEISKAQNFTFQGQDLNDTKASFNFKMQFDKIFTLVKEFYVKFNETQSMYDSINKDMDDGFMKELYKQRNSKPVKQAKSEFMKKLNSDLNGFKFQDSIDKIKSKMTKTLASKDDMFLKYAKLKMVVDGLNAIFKFIEDNDDDEDFNIALSTFLYETDDGDEIGDILKAIEETYKGNSEKLKKEIMLSLKDKPELRNRLDVKSTLRLSRYEGSASNVLRDILLTSSSMVQEINNKRVI